MNPTAQPENAGEFVLLGVVHYCRLCGAQTLIASAPGAPIRLSCSNPDCPQSRRHYEPPVVYLQAKP